MKLFIDTSLPTMIIVLFKDNKVIDSFISSEQKKADLLPGAFNDLLKKNNINIKDIKVFYVTLGPGSFMGSRTALTFIRTIAQVLGTKLWVSNTLEFLSSQIREKVFLDAKSNQSFMYDPITNETSLVPYQEDSKIDYLDLINNIFNYLQSFKEIDPKDARPIYLKDPRIGGK